MATKKAKYGYTIADDADSTSADQSGNKFDTEKLRRGQAQLVETPKPDRKSMRYLGMEENLDSDASKAGAGRGKQGGPTAKQADQNRAFMSATEKAARNDAAEMKLQQRTNKAYEDAGKGMKKGGSVSSRADGCAQRGKTKGKMVTMKNGGMC